VSGHVYWFIFGLALAVCALAGWLLAREAHRAEQREQERWRRKMGGRR
jgi:hypothetical protein